jgi:hypothetical protein
MSGVPDARAMVARSGACAKAGIEADMENAMAPSAAAIKRRFMFKTR